MTDIIFIIGELVRCTGHAGIMRHTRNRSISGHTNTMANIYTASRSKMSVTLQDDQVYWLHDQLLGCTWQNSCSEGSRRTQIQTQITLAVTIKTLPKK